MNPIGTLHSVSSFAQRRGILDQVHVDRIAFVNARRLIWRLGLSFATKLLRSNLLFKRKQLSGLPLSFVYKQFGFGDTLTYCFHSLSLPVFDFYIVNDFIELQKMSISL